MKITKVSKNSKRTTVYDFTVKDVHHYLLDNGVVTHNSYVPTKAMSGGCLVAGTPVILPGGHTKSIEDFAVGDVVATAYGPCTVIETYQYNDIPTFEITLENGEVIHCSNQHRFLVNGEWKRTDELTCDDKVAVVRNINSDEEQHDLSLLLPDYE